MEKITLKLFEFYQLDAEINGIVNQQTGEKLSTGLIQEKLSLTTKYWLTKLSKKVAEEKGVIEELKNDLIKKYGVANTDGSVSIPVVVDELDAEGNPVTETDQEGKSVVKKKVNPDFQQFEKEFNELLQTDKELDYKAFGLEEFEKVETTENYSTFFKLVKVEEEA